MMKGRQTLISALQITTRSKNFVEKLAEKR